MKKIIIVLLVITNVLSLGYLLYFINTKPATSKTANASTLLAKTPVLPADAVKVSECIPFEGEHWVQPSKIPHGPVYVVHNNEIVGMEFMFLPKDIPGEKEANMPMEEMMGLIQSGKMQLSDFVMAHDFKFNLFDYPYKSFSMTWSSAHTGYTEPHYDLHLFMIEDAEAQEICPDQKIENAVSPEVIENHQRYNIPFPGLEDTQKKR